MELWVLVVVAAMLFAVSNVQAVLHEIQRFADIERLTDTRFTPTETLYLFDLDNTLMTPTADVGSDQWFYCLYQAIGKKPLEDANVDLKLVEIWNQIQHSIIIEPSEADLPQWIKLQQTKGYSTMALTARSNNMLEVSIRQLASIGIDLNNAAIAAAGGVHIIAKELLDGVEEAKFANGVLAVGESNVKAKALRAFFQTTAAAMNKIRKIVFVDDKHYHCEAMHQLLLEINQNHVLIEAYRYGQLDARVKQFNCDVEATRRNFFL